MGHVFRRDAGVDMPGVLHWYRRVFLVMEAESTSVHLAARLEADCSIPIDTRTSLPLTHDVQLLLHGVTDLPCELYHWLDLGLNVHPVFVVDLAVSDGANVW